MNVEQFQELLAELRQISRRGVSRSRDLTLPVLSGLAGRVGRWSAGAEVRGILALAVQDLGDGLGDEAEYLLGLKAGTQVWTLTARRSRAAELRGIQPDTYRKEPEREVLSLVADAVVRTVELHNPQSEMGREDHCGIQSGSDPRNSMSGHIFNAVQARDIGSVVFLSERAWELDPKGFPERPVVLFRETELEAWEEMANDPYRSRMVVVGGEPGSGASAVGLEIAYRDSVRNQTEAVYVDARVESSILGVLRATLESLGLPTRALPSTLSGAVSLYRATSAKRPMTFLFDNLSSETDPELLAPLAPSSAVVVRSWSKWDRNQVGIHTIRLRELSDVELDSLSISLSEPNGIPRATRSALIGLASGRAGDVVRMSRAMSEYPVQDQVDALQAIAMLPRGVQADIGLLTRLPLKWFGIEEFRALSMGGADPDATLRAYAQAGLVASAGNADYKYRVVGTFRDASSDPDLGQTAIAMLTSSLSSRLEAAIAAEDVADAGDSGFKAPLKVAVAYRLEDYCELALDQSEALLDARRYTDALGLLLATRPFFLQAFDFPNWARASALAIRASELSERQTDIAQAQLFRAHFSLRMRSYPDARRHLRVARKVSQGTADFATLREAMNVEGLCAMLDDRHDKAERWFKRAQVRSSPGGRWHALIACNLVENALRSRSRTADVSALLPHGAAFNRDMPSLGNWAWLMAWTCRRTGDLTTALGYIDDALKIAQTARALVWEAFWLCERSRTLLLDGRLTEAFEDADRSVRLESELGNLEREGFAELQRGVVLLSTSDEEGARQDFDRALNVLDLYPSRFATNALRLAGVANSFEVRGLSQEKVTRDGVLPFPSLTLFTEMLQRDPQALARVW